MALMLEMPFVSTSASEPFDEQVIKAEVLERQLIEEGCSEAFYAAVVDN